MTAFDNLKLKAICMGIYKKNYIREIIECVGLGMVGNKKVKNFSLGMKQRLGIGMALIGEPDLLVLDEPINGLDPQGIVDVRETIMKLNRERNITIIISSHILEELSKLVTHYGIIDQGSLVEELTKEELYEKCSERIEVALDEPEKACTILDSLKIHNYKVVNSKTIHIFERLEEVADINMEFSLNKIKISSIGVNKDNLEKYFMDLTGGVENA
jgi:ABC-2 type transport system ATP-binding protein